MPNRVHPSAQVVQSTNQVSFEGETKPIWEWGAMCKAQVNQPFLNAQRAIRAPITRLKVIKG